MGCWNSIPKEFINSDVPFYQIKWEAKIWNKESHGLFDYDNKNMVYAHNDIKGNFFLYGNKTEIFPLLPSVLPDQNNVK